jgi:hypothetical protein
MPGIESAHNANTFWQIICRPLQISQLEGETSGNIQGYCDKKLASKMECILTPCNGHMSHQYVRINCDFLMRFAVGGPRKYDLNFSRHVFPMCTSSRFIGNSRFSPSLIFSNAKKITAREDSTDVYIMWSSGPPFETLWILCNI